ncbi:MAG: ATP phosphoribosyltransferase regulatory subunit [Spirochaetaceae bacterium]|nr:ATP phosphoribosyltransferase regulatory subunit [Spirochaetaceae bacterium]
MSLPNQDQLHIPRGTESLHLEEALKHRNILRTMENQVHSWGYLPSKTPVLDYYDNYSEYLAPKRKEESYRLIDRDGELLLLRSDITLFLARQISINLKDDQLPLRTYYADTILRYQKKEDISHNEFFQTGCELIGKEGKDGDLEILFLLKEILDQLNIQDYRIHLGSKSLFTEVFKDLDKSQKKDIMAALINRDQDAMSEILALKAKDKKWISFIINFFFFIGTLEEFNNFIKVQSSHLTEESQKEINKLIQLCDQIKALDAQDVFRIDLSEIGNQNYYSSLVFQCYLPGADSAIASGGRYDGLISCKGKPISSVGFSLLLRKIEALLPTEERPEPLIINESNSFSQRLKEARILRKEGKAVIL